MPKLTSLDKDAIIAFVAESGPDGTASEADIRRHFERRREFEKAMEGLLGAHILMRVTVKDGHTAARLKLIRQRLRGHLPGFDPSAHQAEIAFPQEPAELNLLLAAEPVCVEPTHSITIDINRTQNLELKSYNSRRTDWRDLKQQILAMSKPWDADALFQILQELAGGHFRARNGNNYLNLWRKRLREHPERIHELCYRRCVELIEQTGQMQLSPGILNANYCDKYENSAENHRTDR